MAGLLAHQSSATHCLCCPPSSAQYWHWTDRQRVETYYAKVAKKEASS
jgi:hypothetical protein